MNSAARRLILFFYLIASAHAQNVQVDITHSHIRKSFVPNQALGAGIDRLSQPFIDATFTKPVIDRVLEAGWGPVSYRQNTELYTEAWHWNPQGKWSSPKGDGYFVGDSNPTEMIRYSYGYPLPRRGVTRNDGTETVGYSRLTRRRHKYVLEKQSLPEQGVHRRRSGQPAVDFPRSFQRAKCRRYSASRGANRVRTALRGAVFHRRRSYHRAPNKGLWQNFPFGLIADGKGGTPTIHLASSPVPVRWIRIWMTESSNTCDADGSSDRPNCVGYAIRELYVGNLGEKGEFHDILRHIPDHRSDSYVLLFCRSLAWTSGS